MSNARRELEQDGMLYIECYSCKFNNNIFVNRCSKCRQAKPSLFEEK